MKKIFVDSLAGGAIRGDVVRLDFGEIEAVHGEKKQESEDTPSRFDTVHRLYIPVAGFAQTFQAMQKMMERIEEEAKKQPPAAEAKKPAAPAKKTPPTKKKATSANSGQ